MNTLYHPICCFRESGLFLLLIEDTVVTIHQTENPVCFYFRTVASQHPESNRNEWEEFSYPGYNSIIISMSLIPDTPLCWEEIPRVGQILYGCVRAWWIHLHPFESF
jgi:hypothetical protein